MYNIMLAEIKKKDMLKNFLEQHLFYLKTAKIA